MSLGTLLAARSSFGIYSGPLTDHSNLQMAHLTSTTAACCWIPLFALRSEEARRPELASQPGALLAPDTARLLWQVSPLARRAGVKPGMTVSQAIGLCPSLRLCEPDPVYYDEQFARLLAALSEVSPVVEPAELGRAYVGTDGLEGLYGAPEGIVEVIKRGTRNAGWKIARLFRVPISAFRVPGGVGEGQVRLLGRRYARATGGSRDRPPGGGGAVSLRPTTRRPPARSRHAPPAAPARAQDSRPARRVAGGSGRLAVRRCRPQAVAARSGGGSRAGRGP